MSARSTTITINYLRIREDLLRLQDAAEHVLGEGLRVNRLAAHGPLLLLLALHSRAALVLLGLESGANLYFYYKMA